MSDTRLRVGGPSVYGLHAQSEIGGELYERELVRRLPAHGVREIIGLPAGHGLGVTPGVSVVGLPPGATRHWTLAPLGLIAWATALAGSGRIDVLRAPSVRYHGPSLLAARRLVRSRVPVVIHHHHFEPRWRRLEAAILRAADTVITVSEHSRAELLDAGVDPERIAIARNGIDGPAGLHPEPAATWPGDGVRLLYLGRLEDRKRPALAIETLAALRDAGHAASLLLAGDGPARAGLEDRARALGVAHRVHFLGRVPDARKWALYDGAQLLLFGSTLEGFGLVVAEAQSRGLPVIAAAGTATAEALVDGVTGHLTAPTATAFRDATVAVTDEGVLARMGAAAREFATRFSWDACAAQAAAALRETARGGPR